MVRCGNGSGWWRSRRSCSSPRTGRCRPSAAASTRTRCAGRPTSCWRGNPVNAPTLAFALVAGAVAAFNPCGFALLPAYLGLQVATGEGKAAPVGRAVRFTFGMTVGFVAVFGAVGLVLAPLTGSIERYLPVVTVVIGMLLVGGGGWLLAGRHLALPGLSGWGRAPTAGWWSAGGDGGSVALGCP